MTRERSREIAFVRHIERERRIGTFLSAFRKELLAADRAVGCHYETPAYRVNQRRNPNGTALIDNKLDAVRAFLRDDSKKAEVNWGTTVLSEAVMPFILHEVYGAESPSFPFLFSLSGSCLDGSYAEEERFYQKGGDCLARGRVPGGLKPAFLIDVTLQKKDIHITKLRKPGMNVVLGIPTVVLPLNTIMMRNNAEGEVVDFATYLCTRARSEIREKGTILLKDEDTALLRTQVPHLLDTGFSDCVNTLIPTSSDSEFMRRKKADAQRKATQLRQFFLQQGRQLRTGI